MAFDLSGLKPRRPDIAGPGETIIHLTKGFTAVINTIDLPLLLGRSFYANQSRSKIYARNRDIGYLHQVIAGVGAGAVVDHQNGDGLDCRRNNLRVVGFDKNAQNAAYNFAKIQKDSLFRGVSKAGKKYRARLAAGGVTYSIGSFDDEVAAAKAYDAFAIKLYGPFAWTNFDRDLTPGELEPSDIPF